MRLQRLSRSKHRFRRKRPPFYRTRYWPTRPLNLGGPKGMRHQSLRNRKFQYCQLMIHTARSFFPIALGMDLGNHLKRSPAWIEDSPTARSGASALLRQAAGKALCGAGTMRDTGHILHILEGRVRESSYGKILERAARIVIQLRWQPIGKGPGKALWSAASAPGLCRPETAPWRRSSQ